MDFGVKQINHFPPFGDFFKKVFQKSIFNIKSHQTTKCINKTSFEKKWLQDHQDPLKNYQNLENCAIFKIWLFYFRNLIDRLFWTTNTRFSKVKSHMWKNETSVNILWTLKVRKSQKHFVLETLLFLKLYCLSKNKQNIWQNYALEFKKWLNKTIKGPFSC